MKKILDIVKSEFWSKKQWRKWKKFQIINENKYRKIILRKNPTLNITKDIPYGYYCYDNNGVCKYWYSIGDQIAGCKLIQKTDKDDGHLQLLWDQCKSCCLNNR